MSRFDKKKHFVGFSNTRSLAMDNFTFFTDVATAHHVDMNETTAMNFLWNETLVTSAPPASEALELMRTICEVVISLPLAILGIIGNLLAFVILCQQKQRLTTTVLLQALAVADTLVLISTVLLRSPRYVGWETYKRDVHHYVFVALYPCVYFFRLAGMWVTVMLTIDRYIAVCHPLHAQRLCTLKRTYISIVVISVLTLLFSIPRFFEHRLYEVGFVYTGLAFNAIYAVVYRIILFFLVMYLVPTGVLAVLNVRLMCTLRRAYTKRNSMILHDYKGVQINRKASRSVTIIVSTIVIVCVVCNIIAMTTHVLWALHMCFDSLKYLEDSRRLISHVSNAMVTFNCAINFVIYCLFSRKFRTGLNKACSCESVRRLRRRWSAESSGNPNMNTSFTSNGLIVARFHVRKPDSSYTLKYHQPNTLRW